MALIRASDKRFYCYELRRPDGSPFYVGIGQDRRILVHRRRDNLRNSKISLIQRVLGVGVQADYSIVGFFDTQEDAYAEEQRLIASYGRIDLGTGTLANGTDGGHGIVGIKWEFTPARADGAKRAAEKNRARDTPTPAQKTAAKHRGPPTAFIEGARKWREANMDKLIEERQTRWKDPLKRQTITKANIETHGRPVVVNGTRYPSVSAAALSLGVSRPTITYRIAVRVPGYFDADDI